MVSLEDKHIFQILDYFHENKLSHAFLIETNNQELLLEDLKQILCEINCENNYQQSCKLCNLCHLIKTENLPSFIVIRPDGQTIRKDQILELKQRFSTKPIYSKYNMYVIMNAEKLNISSANTILKFLEEPEAGILGFFITNNKENIIDTIKSRCQLISNFYELNQIIDEEICNLAIDLIKEIHLSKDKALLYNKKIISTISKEKLQLALRQMIQIYYYFYQEKFASFQQELYSEVSFLKKKDVSYLINQLQLLQALELEINSNVNLNLLLDRLVIETR